MRRYRLWPIRSGRVRRVSVGSWVGKLIGLQPHGVAQDPLATVLIPYVWRAELVGQGQEVVLGHLRVGELFRRDGELLLADGEVVHQIVLETCWPFAVEAFD